jgi:predicted RNase H-like nuclease (RuvC/YqgF family)
MIMAESTIIKSAPEDRLVTVADLRHELHNERRITDSRFGEAANRVETVDYRVTLLDQKVDDFKAETLRGFEQVDRRFEQVDKRFDQVDKRFEHVDRRFEQVDKRFDRIDARFDALDERLRSNKTLLILSASTASSIASVVISLLK